MKWLLAGLAAAALLAVAAVAALPRIVDTPRVQSLIASGASQALGRPVKFRSVSLALLPHPAVRLHAMEVADDPAFGPAPFLRLDDADLRLKLWPLLRGHVEFTTLVLTRPTIVLIQSATGRWNFASLGGARETAPALRAPRPASAAGVAPPLVSRVVIDDGLVTYESQGLSGATARYRLDGVRATLTSRPAAFGFEGAARLEPGGIALTLAEGTLGWTAGRALGEATVRARLELRAADVGPVAAAMLGPEPAVDGVLTGRMQIAGTLARPRLAGEITLERPTVTRTSSDCPQPRRRLPLGTVQAKVAWNDGGLVVESLTSTLRNGRLSTRAATAATAPVHAELSGLALEAIPLEPVLVEFLCQGYAVTGPLDLRGTLTFAPADPAQTLGGSGRLIVGPGTVVGPRALSLLGGLARLGGTVGSALALEVPALPSTSPLAFESIAGSYEIARGVVRTRDLVYTSRALTARVRGDYALPTGRMNVDVILEHGRRSFQAKVTGTAATPSIRLTPTLGRGLESERVEHGLRELVRRFR